jgi:hypothetical protein
MISIIKGISPTVLFSLSLVCHSKKIIYKQNRNLINRLFILIPYLNKFGEKKNYKLKYIHIPFATFVEDSGQDSYKILKLH